MSANLGGYRTVRGRGRITAEQFADETGYELHMDPVGRIHLVRFDEHPDALPDGTTLHLTLEDGRVLLCNILDDSPYCAVIGEGVRHGARVSVRVAVQPTPNEKHRSQELQDDGQVDK